MTTVTYLKEPRPYFSGRRRALFYDKSNSNDITVTLRELPDSALEYFSYILRKKWAADFINGASTLVPGHLKVKISNSSSTYSSNIPNTWGDPVDTYYTNLAHSSYGNGNGGIANYQRLYRYEYTQGNNTSPPPGADVPSPSPDIRFETNNMAYTFCRLDYNIPNVRTTSDFADYGYLTTFDIDRILGTEEYLVAENNTTGMTDGVDKFKLEKTTIVNDTSQGDSHKFLVDARSKQINLKQIGTGIGHGSSDPSRPTADNVSYSGGLDAEADVIDYLFSDIEKRLREQEVGAVRIAGFQDEAINSDLNSLTFHGNSYNKNDWIWHDLGIVFSDTRLAVDPDVDPAVIIQQYNMYINEDYAAENNMKPNAPTYKDSTIKLLRPYFGTNQSDGRRLVEMEITETSDFITNFLYQIFLRRYPVYDFFTTNYGYGNSNGNTFAGSMTDTYYTGSDVYLYPLSGITPPSPSPYTKRTTAHTTGSVNVTTRHLHFCGLRGQSGINVRYPNL